MAIRILSSENITGNLTLSGNQTTGGDLYVTGTSNSLVVISRDNMYVDAGQLYIGADDSTTDDTFRQRVTSGSYFIESRKSGTWTNRLQINTAGTLIVQQGMAISGNIDGVGASFIGTAASGAALVTIENNSGSTATSYGLLVIGGGHSSNGRTFEVRDASGNSDLIVKGNGYVGIGTDSPSAPLTVHGQQKWYTTNNDGNELRGFFNPGGSGDPAELSLYQANGTSVGVELRAAGNSYLNGGNVGIGTTSPDANLEIFTSSGPSLLLTAGGSGTAGFKITKGDSGTAYINNVDNVGMQFQIANGTKMTIASGGNVGIGTTSPDAQLELKKETTWGTLDNQVIYINNTGTGGNTGALHDMGSITWRSGNVNTAAISGIRNTPGSGNNVDLRFTTATQSGGQQTSMTILSGGNVGIGTTSPQFKLDVQSNSDTAPSAYLRGGKSSQGEIQNTGLIIGTQTDMVAGDYQGISFTGYTSASAIRRGRAAIGVEAINGPGKMDLVFMTRYADDGTQLGAADEKMRITSAGNVVINYTATGGVVDPVNSKFTVATQPPYNYANSKIEPTTATFFSDKMTNNDYNSILQLVSVRTSLTSGQNSNGYLGFSTLDNSNAQGVIDAGRIAIVNENGVARNSPTALSFWTNTPNGNVDNTPATEKMRIKSGGNVLIGTTDLVSSYDAHAICRDSPSGYALIVKNSNTSTTNNTVMQLNRAETTATTGGYALIYRQGNASTGTNRMIVFANGNIQNTNNSYGSLSDERKKENIVDATPKLDDLMKVKVRNFNLKGEETKQIGVVAQELEEVFPGMILESKDPDSEDETLYKGVKYSVFVPMLIKAIQELKAEIELLKNK